ncbi:MAG: ImmA/IrrE family metallo-endopeptidase [Oscillospiraceae bacterium]|nr:ImmA/IrrE family metallo-endopeptidase [Oscillospiraceae bacterium]
MIDYEGIVSRVAALKRDFPRMDPEEIIRTHGINLLRSPMGTSSSAIKGFIQKNNRCCTIVVNSDLSDWLVHKILFHEEGHFVLRHLELHRSAFLCDRDLSFRRDRTLEARLENEANFFAAECTLDTGETLEAIRSYDMKTAAQMLCVPVEFLDYKLRLLHRTGQLDRYDDVFGARSDCLHRI